MTKFEDHLWREFVREHADSLAQLARPSGRQSRRPRLRLVAGTGLGLAATGAALAFVLGATSTSPAFAVTRNQDGTVTVSVTRRTGIAGANSKLHALGIRAQVLPQAVVRCGDLPGHGAPAPKGNFTNARWTIDPRQIPQGRMLSLAPPPSPGRAGGNSASSEHSRTATSDGTATNGGNQVPVPSGNSGDSGTATSESTATTERSATSEGTATTESTATTERSATNEGTAKTESSATSEGTATNGGNRVAVPSGNSGNRTGWTLSCPQLPQHGQGKPGHRTRDGGNSGDSSNG